MYEDKVKCKSCGKLLGRTNLNYCRDCLKKELSRVYSQLLPKKG